MKKYLILYPFLMLLAVGLFAQNQHDKVLVKSQEQIIKELSGAFPTKDGILIENRSAAENRKLTREYLSELIKDIGLEPKVQDYQMPNLNPLIDILFSPFEGANVYARLAASSDSDEYIILGAHFDTEYNCPGAIDNATGVALIYKVVYELSKIEQRNKNVIIVFFDQEEEELVGSQAFAKYVISENLNIHSVHTFDTMGWDKDGDRAVELELPTPYLKKAYETQAKKLNIPTYISPCNSTDHHSFRTLGFDAVGLTDEYYNGDYPPLKDTPKDKFETVNLKYLESCTALVLETIKELIK